MKPPAPPLPEAFCAAKWLQVTIDLANGTTHSCHHPERHRIPEEELKTNPSALHNTSFKKSVRRQMLEGIRPKECSFCWKLEDETATGISDRFIKSSDPWAAPYLDNLLKMPWDADVNPTYLEVMLDDLCNCSCIYCLGSISTSVASEMHRHGPYPVAAWRNRMPLPNPPRDPQVYSDAFYRWLPEILPSLHVLRITGGEPLLSPKWAQLQALLRGQKSPKLTLALNSHLSHPPDRFDAFLKDFRALKDSGHVGALELFTSLDAWGGEAEYIRHGLELELWQRNIRAFAEALPGTPIIVMCTFNLLSFSGIRKLLEEILEMKKIHSQLCIDAALLRYPEYLFPDLATPELKAKLTSALDFMKAARQPGFTTHEIQKFQNIHEALECPMAEEELARLRADFYRFIHEFDRRKGSVFLTHFSEYRDFLIECKKAFLATLGSSGSRPGSLTP